MARCEEKLCKCCSLTADAPNRVADVVSDQQSARFVTSQAEKSAHCIAAVRQYMRSVRSAPTKQAIHRHQDGMDGVAADASRRIGDIPGHHVLSLPGELIPAACCNVGKPAIALRTKRVS
jgi:hypothetical protein